MLPIQPEIALPGTPPQKAEGVVLVWNVLCLGLLVNIVVVAILSTPVRFRYFMNEPVNLLPSVFPWVWLPMFLVQVALLGHLLVFRMLRSAQSAAVNPPGASSRVG